MILIAACGPKSSPEEDGPVSYEKGTFGYDLQFLREHHDDLLVLSESDSGAQVAIVPGYQARVMTSSASGPSGSSYGWINYKHIAADAFVPHMNPYGGEERFWLGPEGGQYALYFKPGDPFDLEHWQTPGLIDTAVFPLVSSAGNSALFEKKATLQNYAGTDFQVQISRRISLLGRAELEKELGAGLPGQLRMVAYATDNALENAGDQAWKKDRGLLSIWLLGMFNPSPETVVMIPLQGEKPGQGITDDYFGKIPAERLEKRDSVLFLLADGKYRSKVGVAPRYAKPVAASYDFANNVLTLIRFDLDPEGDYVNSKWEIQQKPYGGDVVNAYNDGPLDDGSQMGPFYELESSSPAIELGPGETMRHRQITAHFEGDYADLNRLSKQLTGIDLEDAKALLK